MSQEITTNRLFKDIKELIESARTRLSREFNSVHLALNWHIGMRINTEILKSERADYGQKVISTLASKLHDQRPWIR